MLLTVKNQLRSWCVEKGNLLMIRESSLETDNIAILDLCLLQSVFGLQWFNHGVLDFLAKVSTIENESEHGSFTDLVQRYHWRVSRRPAHHLLYMRY